MKKIKDKFKLIRKDKSSAAFAVYFFVIIVLLVVQLVNCKEKDFDTYVFGTKTDELYEILDNKCIETEFKVEKNGASGVVIYGYENNNIKFTNEKIIVSFSDADSGKIIEKQELYFKDQVNEKDIYVPFESKVKNGTRVKMSLRSVGLEKRGPFVGCSYTNKNADISRINGEVKQEYLCAAVCYDMIKYNWMKPCVYFIAEIWIGLFMAFIMKKTKLPLFSLKKKAKTKQKIQLRKMIICFLVLMGILFVFFDYIYMKTMESVVREKDEDIVCQEENEMVTKIPLDSSKVIEQEFTASDNNLSAAAIHMLNIDKAKGCIVYKIYDNETGELLFEKKNKLTKLDKITRHLTQNGKNNISEIEKQYVVLEFPKVLDQSKGKAYRISLNVENADNDDIMLVCGQGNEFSYKLNSNILNGNVCMISLYSNQLFFAKIFKYLMVLVIALIILLGLLSVWGNLSLGKSFVISAIILAFIYSFLIPPYCVPDERAHINAVYAISNNILGIEDAPGPNRMYKRECDIDNSKENTMDVSVELYRETFENLGKRTDNEQSIMVYADNPVGSATFLNYLPAAIGFTVARILHLNMVTMIMYGRWMNALATIILIWLGIRKIPFGKSVLAVFALFPIMIQQLASCSYDGILIGAAFIYGAYGVKLIYAEEKSIMDLGIMIFAGGFFATACKGGVYIPLLGVFLLVFGKIGSCIKEKIGWLVCTAIPLGLIFSGQFLQRILGVFAGNEGNAFKSNSELYTISYFKSAPNKLIRLYQNTIATQGDAHLQQTIGGKLGRLNVNIPWYILIVFLFLVFLAGLKNVNEKTYIKRKERLFVAFLCAISVAIVMLSMLLAFTNVESNYIAGVQGRYFLPALCVLLPFIRNEKIVLANKNELFFSQMAVVLNIFVIGFALLSILG